MRMTDFYVRSYKAMYPGIQGCGLHDPLAVAIAEDPSLAETERMLVDVELNGALTRGSRRSPIVEGRPKLCTTPRSARASIRPASRPIFSPRLKGGQGVSEAAGRLSKGSA